MDTAAQGSDNSSNQDQISKLRDLVNKVSLPSGLTEKLNEHLDRLFRL